MEAKSQENISNAPLDDDESTQLEPEDQLED